jgi:hypothetical protein
VVHPPIDGSFGYEPSDMQDYQSATVSASDTQASYQFSCMDGTSAAIAPDANGAFSVRGTLTELGGQGGTFSNVTFAGSVDGDTITFTASFPTTLTTDNGTQPYTEVFGPYVVTKGVNPTRWPGCI